MLENDLSRKLGVHAVLLREGRERKVVDAFHYEAFTGRLIVTEYQL